MFFFFFIRAGQKTHAIFYKNILMPFIKHYLGLNLKPNRKYTQKTSKPFHISLASLDTDSVSDEGANQIFINHDNQKFLICTLRKGNCEQVMLDLNFGEGDEICFQSIGKS